MGERLLCKQEVVGSTPITSTRAVWHQGVLAPGRAAWACGVSREVWVWPRVKRL